MRNLSRKAQFYIGGGLCLGLALLAWNLPHLNTQEPLLLLGVAALASVTQVLKVEGTTRRSSYNVSWMLFGFALVLLGAPATMVVIVVAHLAEWVWHKYPWYIQTFNIANYIIAAQCAAWVLNIPLLAPAPGALAAPLAILLALAVFTFVNHLLIGLVIWLARNETLVQSGVFARLTLMIDYSLLCLGAGAALLWQLNPLAVVVTVIPLYLISQTLRVPTLERQTDTDAKTGLYNARYFDKALDKELAKAKRLDRALTVVVADLDLLRNVNNLYGHLAGDIVLKGIAQILQRSVRAYDVVARFGGEEFTLLMPEVTPEAAVTRLETIRLAIENAEFEVATSVDPIRVTMSFGIASYEHPDQQPNQIMHNADLAVYHSKLNGRNRISLHKRGQTRIVAGGRAQAAVSVSPAAGSEAEGASAPARASEALPARPPTPPAAAPLRLSATWRWLVRAYVGALTLAAVGLLWLTWRPPLVFDGLGLSAFAALAFFVEWFAVDLYVKDTSVSVGAVPLLAAMLLWGPVGAGVVSLTLAVTAGVRHRSLFSRILFNASNHLVAALICAASIQLVGLTLSPQLDPPHLVIQFGVALASSAIVFLSTTLLLALVIRLDAGQPFWPLWQERFSWLGSYYLGMGALAFMWVFSYQMAGLLGLGAVVLPLAVLRYGQEQYVNRTKGMVSQLRAANEELLKQSREVAVLNEELLIALANTTDLRDPYVLGHSQHVARYAVLIATELGLPADQVELVRKAGLLHDIGKLGIPESILFKPGRLTSEEYGVMQGHAAYGAETIAHCHSLYKLVSIVRHHHERYDGQGYPDRLQGEETPLEGRIMALADAVEAMASDRPYRAAMGPAAILAEVQSQAGTQFDPAVVAAFERVVCKGTPAVIVNSAREVQAARGKA